MTQEDECSFKGKPVDQHAASAKDRHYACFDGPHEKPAGRFQSCAVTNRQARSRDGSVGIYISCNQGLFEQNPETRFIQRARPHFDPILDKEIKECHLP